MPTFLLLLEDVQDLGRSGDIVSVKPGYARNFLIPQKKAYIADKNTRRMQQRLQEERAQQAVVDKADAEALAERLSTLTLTTEVKVDQDGHMYGSVTTVDIVRLFAEQGLEMEKRTIALSHPIKAVGEHTLNLRLKEGVKATCTLHIVPEGKTIAASAAE